MTAAGMKSGVKLTLEIKGRTCISTFYKDCGDGSCLVSMPLKEVRGLPIPNGTNVVISYFVNTVRFLVNAEIIGMTKEGIRSYLKVRLTGEPIEAERRAHIRVATSLPAIIMVQGQSTGGAPEEREYRGTICDLSSGGAAIETNAAAGIGETLLIYFEVKGLEKRPFQSEVCWLRRTGEKSEYATEIGVRFLVDKVEGAYIDKLIRSLREK